MANDHLYSRFYPCKILREHKIPCIIWFEDAAAHYGVPTVVFVLHLLVPNIVEAGQVLADCGWTVEEITQGSPQCTQVTGAHHILQPPQERVEISEMEKWTSGHGPRPLPSTRRPGPTVTILLPAAD